MRTNKRGKRGLTLRELRVSALVCFRNAEELLSDAELLFLNHRYARAIFLSCIGTEEVGKAVLCLDLFESNYQFDNEDNIKDFWLSWYDHQSKTGRGLGYSSSFPFKLKKPSGLFDIEDISDLKGFTEHEEEFFEDYSFITTKLKEYAIYVDILEKDDNAFLFMLPSRILNKEGAEHFIITFKDRIEELKLRFDSLGSLKFGSYPNS